MNHPPARFEVALFEAVLSKSVLRKNSENLRMTSSIGFSPATAKALAMINITESVSQLKRFASNLGLKQFAELMVLRLVLTFLFHRGRMSCSQAGGSIRTEPVHRSQITRFLKRPTWQRGDFNAPLREQLLQLESVKGKFIFIVDATLNSQTGKKPKTLSAPATDSVGHAKVAVTTRPNGPAEHATVLLSVC